MPLGGYRGDILSSYLVTNVYFCR